MIHPHAPHAPLPYDCDACGGSTEGANLSVAVGLCLDCYELRLTEDRERAEAVHERRCYAADQQRKAAFDERAELYSDSQPDGRGADEGL